MYLFCTRRQQTSVVSDSLKMGLGLNRCLAYVVFSTPRQQTSVASDSFKMGLGLNRRLAYVAFLHVVGGSVGQR